jgi:hypothetical protein
MCPRACSPGSRTSITTVLPLASHALSVAGSMHINDFIAIRCPSALK